MVCNFAGADGKGCAKQLAMPDALFADVLEELLLDSGPYAALHLPTARALTAAVFSRIWAKVACQGNCMGVRA